MHTLMELHSSLPVYVNVTTGDVHDVNMLDQFRLEPGSILIVDRAYLDFERLFELGQQGTFFIIRAKKNLRFHRICRRWKQMWAFSATRLLN